MISGFFIFFFQKSFSTFPCIPRKAPFREKRFIKNLGHNPKVLGLYFTFSCLVPKLREQEHSIPNIKLWNSVRLKGEYIYNNIGTKVNSQNISRKRDGIKPFVPHFLYVSFPLQNFVFRLGSVNILFNLKL